MLIPDRLQAMLEDGLLLRVLRPLKSGKEAEVFVVEATEGGICAAKVYKEAHRRNFRQRGDYVEGRRTGDSREDRAMAGGSRFGRERQEAAWQTAEADTMRRLEAAGVRCPRLRLLGEGVILMDLVVGADGEPAPQLVTRRFTREEALRWHYQLVREVARMLCAGIVHGDLSEYNILHAADGPRIIDFPQATDAARNSNAKRLLLRDVTSLARFFARFAPELHRAQFGPEMWLLYEQTALTPDTPLTGRFTEARKVVDAQIILREVAAAKEEAARRKEIQALRTKR